jgi:hypothetical protein
MCNLMTQILKMSDIVSTNKCIDKVVGKSRPVGLEDRGKMPYLEATLLEIQRIANTCKYQLLTS